MRKSVQIFAFSPQQLNWVNHMRYPCLTEHHCICGRVWKLSYKRRPLGRSETLACICRRILVRTDNGFLSAELLSPREHWVTVRKLRYSLGRLYLFLRSLLGLPIQASGWSAPCKLAYDKHPNEPVKSRFRIYSKDRR